MLFKMPNKTFGMVGGTEDLRVVVGHELGEGVKVKKVLTGVTLKTQNKIKK